MTHLKAILGADRHAAFMRGLVRGKYHSLLGAGASIGGRSTDGRALPDAARLADELAEAFGIPSPGPAGLRRLYASAQHHTSRNGTSLDDYLKTRFTNTRPPDWMRDFVQLPWAQIWTLNIDDCVETAYNRWHDLARQNVSSISWTERHRVPRNAFDETLLVHLHGKASKAHRESEIIFDISAYINATVSQHRWHRIFGDSYPAQPFLVLGASLDSEIDLQVVIEQGRVTTYEDHPSLIILSEISDFQAQEYRRYGLHPVQMTVDVFFTDVMRELPGYLIELTHDESLSAADTPPEIYTFLSQWQPLEITSPGPARDRHHDFYAGHQPQWRDILLDLPSERDRLQDLSAKLAAKKPPAKDVVVILTGDPFTGKSAFLLAVAKELANRGFVAYLFYADNSPDAHSAVWWMQRHPRSVLIIDDASDFAHEIEEIYGVAEATPISIRVLAAERRSRVQHIENVLAAVQHETIELGRLSGAEVFRLIDKLSEKRRLGVLTGRSRSQQRRYFRERYHELFSSMAELERGRGFVSRIQDEYARIKRPEARRLLGAAAVISSVGYGLPLSIVKGAAGVNPAEIEMMTGEGELADLVTIRRTAVWIRHRVLGTLLVDHCLDKKTTAELAHDITIALAPHVSPTAIRAGTIHYRIARGIMTLQNLSRLLGGDMQAVADWYEAVEAAFDWNARYWEQRALAASEIGAFEAAYSWAREAVVRHEDSYTLNTVGTVLMRRALSEASSGQWPTDSFELGEKALAEARDMEGTSSEYPYETFFHYLSRLMEKVKVRDFALNEQLRILWLNWHARILSLDRASRIRLQKTLRDAQDAWSATGME